MLVPMYQFLKGVEAGIFGNYINLRHVNPFWDVVLSENTIDREQVHQVVTAMLDGMEYYLDDDGDADRVEVTKEGAAIVATSDSYIFSVIPQLSGKELYTVAVDDGVKENGLTASQVSDFVNRACGADRFTSEDVLWLTIKHIYRGYYLSEPIEFALGKFEFTLTVQ